MMPPDATSRRPIRRIHLQFRTLPVDGRSSIAADIPDGHACGIYVYLFEDGRAYVGKSVDVRQRYVEHLQEYRHDPSRPVVREMLFAEVVAGNLDLLDEAETEAIHHFERRYSLTNKLKTDKPLGDGTAAIEVAGGFGVPIPWERDERVRYSVRKNGSPALPEATSSQQKAYAVLAARPDYDVLANLVSRYIGATIAAPADTAGSRWVATALPRTGSGARLITISCQNLETLVILSTSSGVGGFLNVKDAPCLRWPSSLFRLRRASYKAAEDVVSISFHSPGGLAAVLSSGIVLDQAYRLNAELMRRGPSMYQRFCNALLVVDLLERIRA